MLSPDQERIRSILYETITSICKNGLRFDQELRVDALIGVTLDQKEVFLITVNEKIFHDDLQTCQIRKCSTSDHSRAKMETPAARQPAEMDDLLQAKLARKSVDIDARQDSLSDLEGSGTSGISRDILPRTVSVEDGVTTAPMNGSRTASENVMEEALNFRVSSVGPSDEPCREKKQDVAAVRLPAHSQLDARDMLPNERLNNACSLKHYDDTNSVIVIKQEHCEREDSLDDSSVSNGPLTSHGYDDSFNATVSNRPFIRSDPCRILGKQLSLMAASSNSLSLPHRMPDRCDPTSRLSAMCASSVGDIGRSGRMVTSAGHQHNELPVNYGESTSQFYQRRRCRSFLSPYQNSRLNRAFAQSQYLTSEMKAQLAEELQLRANVIGIWFQNRRYKLKKKYLSYQRDASPF